MLIIKNSFSSLLILPIILFIGLTLWNHCQAKSSLFNEHNEKNNLLHWLMIQPHSFSSSSPHPYNKRRKYIGQFKNSFDGNGRRRAFNERLTRTPPILIQTPALPYSLNLQKEDNQNEENFEFISNKKHQENSDSKEAENDNIDNDYVEPVIPWFDEWEKMVKEQEEKKEKKSSKHSTFSVQQPNYQNQRHIQGPCLLRRNKPVQHRTYPRSYEFPGFEISIPRKWDWRNVNGINFCSPTRNQHIPVYCGGCWVFGSLGSLNDRFNIARKNRWPMTNISPQEIIACNGRGRGCNGGTAEDVYEHAKTVGLVEEGCNNFKAVNEKCSPFTRCGSCWPDKCFSIQNYTRYYIKDFGKLTGRLQMMSEIINRGPISCTMGCTPEFDLNYTSGIYREFGEYPPNHIVSVTGWDWDEETKTEYWIVRNSWGEAWGEMGWFRVVTSLFNGGRGDQYNMGIERECYFADPDVSNLN